MHSAQRQELEQYIHTNEIYEKILWNFIWWWKNMIWTMTWKVSSWWKDAEKQQINEK